MVIYTKKGDQGETDLINERVYKDDIRIEAVGQIDELMVLLAMLIRRAGEHEQRVLKQVYKKLFTIHTIIVDVKDVFGYSISDDDVYLLEGEIDRMSEILPKLKNFIFYMGHDTAMLCQQVRARTRGIERLVVRISRDHPLPQHVLNYMNRLSDYFYTLGRYINVIYGVEEEVIKL